MENITDTQTNIDINSNDNDKDIKTGCDKKTPFIYNSMEGIIHDIKTPASSLLFTLQTMRLKSLTDDEREGLFDIAEKQCMRIIQMIQTLIVNENIMNGRLEPVLCNCNIVDLAENITLSAVALAARKKVEIIFDTDTEEKITAVDKMLFERMMYNLISNAIQYSPYDSVIKVCFFDGDEVIRIEITDQGIGINNDMLPILFDRYVTADKNPDSFHFGIGLSIVKEIASILGGRVYVKENTFNFGTTMCVELNVKILENSEIEQENNTSNSRFGEMTQTNLFEFAGDYKNDGIKL